MSLLRDIAIALVFVVVLLTLGYMYKDASRSSTGHRMLIAHLKNMSTTAPVQSADLQNIATATTKQPAELGPPVGTSTLFMCFIDPLSGVGNKMFQYSGSLGLALRHNMHARIVIEDRNLRNAFESMRKVFTFPRFPQRSTTSYSAKRISEIGWGKYDATLDGNSRFGQDVAIFGYLQSWKYFHDVAGVIRQEFQLTQHYVNKTSTFLLQSAPRRTLYIGVHVRRGDMTRRPDLYTVAPPEYLSRAVGYYQKKYGGLQNLTFVIATDDHAWVNDVVAQHLPSNISVAYSKSDAITDMAILSMCNHSIITGGTFGWWSAWLAGGEVVYFKDFIRISSPLYKGYDASDYYPPSWIGIA